MVIIDFETRSKVSIRTAGAWRYAADPSTEVLCLGYKIGDGPAALWTPDMGPLGDLLFGVVGGIRVEAHHAFFEKAIWRNIMVKRFRWPDIPDNRWFCTASRAAAQALPRSLGEVGRILGTAHQKDDEGKNVMLKLARPRTPTKNNPAGWHEDKEDFKTLYKYCLSDVEAEADLSRALRPLRPKEREVWLLDQKINERGIRVDRRAVECAIAMLQENERRLYVEFRKLTGGMVHTVLQRDKLILWLSTQGVSTEKLAKTDVEDLLETPGLPANVKRVLEIRRSLAKTSTKKYAAIANAICDDDRLRDLLMYHGAATGRWTGKLVQPQNFPKQKLKKGLENCFQILKSGDFEAFELAYDDVTGTLSGVIRGVFIPADGCEFYGGDYSAIEARVLFWLSGEKRGTEMFDRGEDPYKDLATTIYTKKLEDITKDEREMGKRGILGCGYGMGKDKFQATCWQFARVQISAELADRVVTAYRDKYRTVVGMWRNQEFAVKEAIENPGKTVPCGRVHWKVQGRYLLCALPSGRLLSYFDPAIEMMETSWGEMKPTITYWSVDSMTKQWAKTKTYGGKLTENLCQAVARDLMAEAMLRVEAAGYNVVLSVHDELLAERAGGSVEEFENLMATRPDWAKSLPVKAEGWHGKRYQK